LNVEKKKKKKQRQRAWRPWPKKGGLREGSWTAMERGKRKGGSPGKITKKTALSWMGKRIVEGKLGGINVQRNGF